MHRMARRVIPAIILGLALAGATTVALSQQQQQPQSPLGYDDTPMQPNGKWHIHDAKRPQPRVVTPGPAGEPLPAPSDAIVLLGKGADLSAWKMSTDGSAVTWPVKDGILQSGKGMIQTKEQFSDVQLHVEFATPSDVKGNSQGRGNSGVFLAGVFEIQVLDSYQNQTYPDGQASAMYGQFPPLVNASRPPGEWQTYDIVFIAPRFAASGQLEKPATATVLHNGIIVHNATAFLGPTQHKSIGKYLPQHVKGPLQLQDHGNPVRFRNIWIRPLKGYDE
jgi:3-keto-disaccharide hydrolase